MGSLSVQSGLCLGGLCPGAVSVHGGLCLGGGLCPGGSLRGLCPRGVSVRGLSGGVSVHGGLCPVGSLSKGGRVCLGVSLTETPFPPVNRMTDMCKKHYLTATLLQVVIMKITIMFCGDFPQSLKREAK